MKRVRAEAPWWRALREGSNGYPFWLKDEMDDKGVKRISWAKVLVRLEMKKMLEA
jgi:hypothetical protein